MRTRKKAGKALVLGGTPRVNLLPPVERESRARRALRRRWLGAAICAVALVIAGAGLSAFWTVQIDRDQAAAAQRSKQLQSELAQYSQAVYLRAHLQKLESLVAQAGSNDQSWGPLITEVKSVLPKGVRLIGFTVVPGAAPVPGADPSTQVGLKGTLTFSAATTSAQAETISQLRTLLTFIDVDAGELSSNGPTAGFSFVATFSADQTRYTGQFAQREVK